MPVENILKDSSMKARTAQAYMTGDTDLLMDVAREGAERVYTGQDTPVPVNDPLMEKIITNLMAQCVNLGMGLGAEAALRASQEEIAKRLTP